MHVRGVDDGDKGGGSSGSSGDGSCRVFKAALDGDCSNCGLPRGAHSLAALTASPYVEWDNEEDGRGDG